MPSHDAAKRQELVAFQGVSRGPRVMKLNGRLQPAYKWCEEFGHYLVDGSCKTCGGVPVAR